METAVTLAATGEAVAVGSKDPKATFSKAKEPPGPASAPDIASAIATARLRNVKVEVLGEGTEQTKTWANPDGTLTTDSYALPFRFKRDGQWVDVDTSLQAAADGSVQPKGHVGGLKLAGGGKNPILAAEGHGDHEVAVGWQGELPKPELKGDTATYRDVTPGADVTVQATRTGFEENVVLNSRPAAGYQVTIPVTAKGLTAKQAPDGSVVFTDANGKDAGSIPAPVMWDAAVDAKSLEHTHRAPVKMDVAQQGDTVLLTLAPDEKFLADPATKYPVTVDPSTSISPVFSTFAQISYTTPQYTSTDLKLGTYNGGADVARSFLQFPVQRLYNSKIQSASLNLWEYWSSNCVQASWELWQTQPADTTTVWTNQPTWNTKYSSTTQTAGYPTTCTGSSPAGWVSIDPSAFLQYGADHGYNYANIGLRATTETDSNSWKRFNSPNASSNVPVLSVTYTSYPMTSAPSVAPGVSSVSGTATTLYTNTATPQLQATVTNADGGNVMVQWNVFDTTGTGNTQVIANLNGSWTASGGISSATIPAGKLLDGHQYTAWPWGYNGTLWSRQTVPSGLVFTVDTTLPGAPTVASTDYPSGGWAKGAGQAGAFTITPPSGGSDTAGVVWQLDNGTQTTVATTGVAVSISATPSADGPHTLTAYTRDLAGNLSAAETYSFNSGSGAVTSPTTGQRTDKRVPLAASGPITTQSVKFQYRRAGTDTWTDIPVANVTNGGTALTAWPVSMTNGASPSLVWDVASTLGDDGSAQVRGEFTTSSPSVFDSSAVTLTLDRVSSLSATSNIGPGQLNLSSGDYGLSATDASAFGLSLMRSASSRNPAGGAPSGQVAPFGPQWSVGGISATAATGYTEIRPVTGSAVQLVMANGSQESFTKNADGSWSPEPGGAAFTLTYNATADQFTLTDTNGTVTLFGKSGSSAGVWTVASTSPSGTGNSTQYRFDTVASGSTTLVRPARIAAATTAVSNLATSCLTPATPAVGCRVLELGYASTTTATGTISGTFGDFAGQINQLVLWLTDPSTGTETSKVVAKYAYDSNGMLRQEWDPRISPTLVASYGYDTAGRVTSLTPPGQLPWSFTYGTAGTSGDTNAGRLLNVSRATLTPGSATQTNGTATTTVVYDVPLTTGTGGPYAMGTADVAAWAQTNMPTDATAIFPADQVPTSNTGPNLTSGSYSRATVHYLDVNGRETNTAVPGAHITTVEWDGNGNIVRQLTPANRELALSSSQELTALGIASAATAQRATLLSTQNVYDSSGLRLTDTYGPLHGVTLERAVAASGTAGALSAGSTVAGRAHTHNTYDENRPTDGSATASNQVTTAVTGTSITGYPADADTRTTTTAYDWTVGKPTRTVVDPAGLAITSVSVYNSAGQITSTSQAASNGTDAGTTTTAYYTAAGTAPCGGHPEWAGLVCQTAPAAAITGGGTNPSQRVTTATTYDLYGNPATVTETANGSTRTTTTTYDAAGRKATVAVSGGVGQAVQTSTTGYDPATGLVASVSTPDGASTSSTYDSLGRQISYSDADGNTARSQYDALDRPTQTTDSAPSTITYTYDTTKDPRGLVTSQTDSNAGTFSGSYDANGKLLTESLPGSVSLTNTIDQAGQTTQRVYTDVSGNVLVSDQVGYSGQGLELTRKLSTSGGLGLNDAYGYDADSRLASTSETVIQGQNQTCTVRTYGFDKDSNRTSLNTNVGSTATAGAAATCPSTGGTTATHAYDAADRLVDSGYGYDAFGRTTAEPNGTTSSYYTNDRAYQQVSGNTRTTWALDPGSRFRSYTTDTNSGGTWSQSASRLNHYDGPNDSPAWIVENTTSRAYTRNVTDLGGLLGASYSSSSGDINLQLTNLHGDVTMSLPINNASAPVIVQAADEYGNPIASTTAGRYSWLGGNQRSSETPTGDILMGVRLYNPALGRFLQIDPVSGSPANAYDYAGQNPLTRYDLDGQCWWSWLCNTYNRHKAQLFGLAVGTLVGGTCSSAASFFGMAWFSVYCGYVGGAIGNTMATYFYADHNARGNPMTYIGAAFWGALGGGVGGGWMMKWGPTRWLLNKLWGWVEWGILWLWYRFL